MEYYPFDISMPNDLRVLTLKKQGGPAWGCWWYELLAMLYQLPEIPIEMEPAIAEFLHAGPEETDEFINAAVSVGLLDRESFDKGIITSHGVKKRKAAMESKSRAGIASGKARRKRPQGEDKE